ncbi:hypothetical protein ACSSS7_003479 [Eimeria intestinalis]
MPPDAAKVATEVAFLREVTPWGGPLGALAPQQSANALVAAEAVINDGTLLANSAPYGSGHGRKTPLTNGVLAGALVPLLVVFSVLFLCMRFYRRGPLSGAQQRRLAEGSQGDDALGEEELQDVLLECFEAAQDADFSESSDDPSDLGWPVPAEEQAIEQSENLGSLQDLQQPSRVDGSTSTELKAPAKGEYYSNFGTALLSEDIWALTDDDFQLGEQDFGTGSKGWADTEDSSTAGTTEVELSSANLLPVRAAEKHKFPLEGFSDDEHQVIIGKDFWWGQGDRRGRAKRRRTRRKFAASRPPTPRIPTLEDPPVTLGPLAEHPLVRLPRVRPGAVSRLLNFKADSLHSSWKSRTQLGLLKEIRELLLMPELGPVKVASLMTSAEALIYLERKAAERDERGTRPSYILEKLASIFMVYDAVVCTMHILGQAEALEGEWQKFTALHKIHYEFPLYTPQKHYEMPRVKHNVRWIRRVSAALEVYKKGYRPAAKEAAGEPGGSTHQAAGSRVEGGGVSGKKTSVWARWVLTHAEAAKIAIRGDAHVSTVNVDVRWRHVNVMSRRVISC